MQAKRRILHRLQCIRRLLIIATCLTLVVIFRGHSSTERSQFAQVTKDIGLINPNPINAVHLGELLVLVMEIQKTIGQPTQVGSYNSIIVHFDLKGAPPKGAYLKQVLELIKNNGATGILIEWEDTFPFTGIFEDIRSSSGYTVAEVKEILSCAQKLELNIIPLAQTFGHLEWILRVIGLSDEEAVRLVTEAIRQVADVHKEFGVKYFHIGADEAFEYGNCEKDIVFIKQQKGDGKDWTLLYCPIDALLLYRTPRAASRENCKMRPISIAQYKAYLFLIFLASIRVLAWYDMLKSFSMDVVSEYKLGDLIEPIVWDYSETVQGQNEWTWRMLASSLKNTWGSSAYKGANNPFSQFIDVRHYVENNGACDVVEGCDWELDTLFNELSALESQLNSSAGGDQISTSKNNDTNLSQRNSTLSTLKIIQHCHSDTHKRFGPLSETCVRPVASFSDCPSCDRDSAFGHSSSTESRNRYRNSAISSSDSCRGCLSTPSPTQQATFLTETFFDAILFSFYLH